MKIAQQTSRPALGRRKYQNEDKVGHSRHGAWVIDGVTRLSEIRMKSRQSNQVRWFALRIHQALERSLDDLSKPIPEILRKVAAEAWESFQEIAVPLSRKSSTIQKEAWPAASVVILREVGNSLEWFVIGDCIAYVETGEQSVIIEHRRSRDILDEIRTKLADLRETHKGMPFSQVRRQIIEPMLKANRKKNSALTIQVLELDPESVDQGGTGNIQTKNGARAILMSDGYARAVDVYRIYGSHHELADESFNTHPDLVIEKIRSKEKEDRECYDYPRLKRSDDASAVLIEKRISMEPLSGKELSRLRNYAEKLQQAEPFTLDEARDMQSLVERSQRQSSNSEALLFAGLLGVAAGVAIGVLGKMAYDYIVGLTEENPDR